MKKISMVGLFLAALCAFIACSGAESTQAPPPEDNASLSSFRIGSATAVLGGPGATPAEAEAGTISVDLFPGEIALISPTIIMQSAGALQYAVTAGEAPAQFFDKVDRLTDGDSLWIKVSSGSKTLYYKIEITLNPYTPSDIVADDTDPFYNEVRGKPPLTFNINSPPSPAQWNTAGEMYEYPNPFVRADGTHITDPLEWESYIDQNGVRHPRPLDNKIPAGWTLEPGGRRAEIKKLVEYYHQGNIPPEPSYVVVLDDPGASGGSTTLEVAAYVGGQEKRAEITATLTMPAIAPNGKPPSPTNKVPLFLGVGSAPAELRQNGWATLVLRQGTDSTTGLVQSIFNYGNTDDRPSNLIRLVWEASRWLDAAERGAWGNCVDASKSAVSGVSRNGKAAMMIGALAESMRGTRIAVSIPASSGGGGTNMERWTHQKQGLNRPAGGYSKFGIMYLTGYAMAGADNYIAVKIPPKDWDEKADQTARRTQIQNLTSIRTESNGGWVGRRMLSFTPQHTNFNLQGTGGGLLSTMPMDAHFIASLTAPNIWMGVDGWNANALGDPPTGDSGWVSQEPVYMTYLATRELYDFLGVEQNCAVLLTMTGHAWPTNQVYAMIDYANWFFNKYHHPNAPSADRYFRQSGIGQQPVHPVDVFTDRLVDGENNPIPHCTWYNPMAREDYLRLNWKNPNRIRQLPHEYSGDNVTEGRSIAANVRAYFKDHPDELKDINGTAVSLDFPAALVPEGN